MDFKYMIVAFLNEQIEGSTLEPPKNPHVTVKKKFKLKGLTDAGLIKLLKSDTPDRAKIVLRTGDSEEYGSAEIMMIEIVNARAWQDLHGHFLNLLEPWSESRDPHFEGNNYLPHVTWRMNGEDNFDPTMYENRTIPINYIYLIERMHPTESVARIVAKLPVFS